MPTETTICSSMKLEVNFVVEEGQAAIDIAKSFGSPFIFLCFTTVPWHAGEVFVFYMFLLAVSFMC